MANELENKQKELLSLNRLWRDTQELEMKDSTLKKIKKKILYKISHCESEIKKIRREKNNG